MKISNIIPLSHGIYELEKGSSDRRLGDGDLAKLLLGGIEAAPTPQKLVENDNFFLPSSLEEDKLMTVFASNDGSYKDEQGKRQSLFGTVLKAVQSMTEGQKILIVGEQVDEIEEEQENARGELLPEEVSGKRIWVIKIVKILKSHLCPAEPTHMSQQSYSLAVVADRGRRENHGNTENHESDSQRQRGPSPVPSALFETLTFDLLVKLWVPRLCPGRIDDDVREALKETLVQIPIMDQRLLCIGSWLFESNPTVSDIWEFYLFTFHEKLETERDRLFNDMGRRWNDSTGENLGTKKVTQWWRNMIQRIGEMIKKRLSVRQYPCCDCIVTQPHSCNDLRKCVALLETLDKNERGQRAKQVVVAFTSLRVFDMIAEEFGTSQHQSLQRYRQVVSDTLKELQDAEGLSRDIQAKLNDIVKYEQKRLKSIGSSELECLADLELS